MLKQGRQRRKAFCREHAEIPESRDRLIRIPPTLESVTAGRIVSRRGNAVVGPALSELEIPEPVPGNWEPVPDNWE